MSQPISADRRQKRRDVAADVQSHEGSGCLDCSHHPLDPGKVELRVNGGAHQGGCGVPDPNDVRSRLDLARGKTGLPGP